MRHAPTLSRVNCWLMVTCLALFACTVAFGQQANSTSSSTPSVSNASSDHPAQQTAKPEAKPHLTLLDVTRVSTSGALKAAAQAKADASAKSHANLTKVDGSKPTAPADSGVVELQPVASGSALSGGPVTASKKSKDSLLKNVHGEVYGAASAGGAGNNAEGGAVGATSKGGKTSIYVHTDRAQGIQPH